MFAPKDTPQHGGKDDDDGDGSPNNDPEPLAAPCLSWRCWLLQSLKPLRRRRREVFRVLCGDMLLASSGILVGADFGEELALVREDGLEAGLLGYVERWLPVGAISLVSRIHRDLRGGDLGHSPDW